jgi:hypothetical protein
LPMEQVERIDDYQAVVVGSGVYMNRWLKPGTDFLKRFRRLRAASRPRRQRVCASAPRASESGWIGSAPVAT